MNERSDTRTMTVNDTGYSPPPPVGLTVRYSNYTATIQQCWTHCKAKLLRLTVLQLYSGLHSHRHIVMAHVVVPHMVMAYTLMAYTVMAYIVRAYLAVAYIIWHIWS